MIATRVFGMLLNRQSQLSRCTAETALIRLILLLVRDREVHWDALGPLGRRLEVGIPPRQNCHRVG